VACIHFVPFEIVCGVGSQVLSELVEQWIRNNDQVANGSNGGYWPGCCSGKLRNIANLCKQKLVVSMYLVNSYLSERR